MDVGQIDGRVTKDGLLKFVGVLEQLCAKLAAAHNFYASIKPVESEKELERGIAACKEHVRYCRSTMWKKGCTLTATGTARHIKPKHHCLETHMPIFARHWGCVGRFSEDIVESIHHVVNLNNADVTNLSNQPLMQFQCNDDIQNLKFELTTKEQYKRPKKRNFSKTIEENDPA
jgi:hypothetical protein